MRTFKGIANHASGHEEDYLHVIEWEEAPDDAADDYETRMTGVSISKILGGSYGSMLGIAGLLPPELRTHDWCAEWGKECWRGKKDENLDEPCPHRDKDWICRPPRFKFKITVETEEVRDKIAKGGKQ